MDVVQFLSLSLKSSAESWQQSHSTATMQQTGMNGTWGERERERLHYVLSASLAYEDGSVFLSGPFAEWL